MKLALHGFLPGLNASPGCRGGSLRNNAGHRCYLAVAYNDWDMIVLRDEMFTREVENNQELCLLEGREHEKRCGFCGRGCTFGKDNSARCITKI